MENTKTYSRYEVGDLVRVVDAKPRYFADEDYKNGDIFEVVRTWGSDDIDNIIGVVVKAPGSFDEEVIEMYVEEVRPFPVTKEYIESYDSAYIPGDEPADIIGDLVIGGTDVVNHPSHYTQGKFEVIEVIEEITGGYSDGYVAYCVGNTIKYLARAPYKHDTPLEDLKKAQKYLEFAIKRLNEKE